MGPVDVAIVGSGASGTLVAVQLLRQARGPWRIALVERSGALARGLAYGPAESCHLLNVPAAGMSALPDDPGHFVRWSGAAPDAFVPRAVYGMYLEALLTEAHARAAPGVTLQFVCGEAVSAAVDDGAVRIALREGREIQARASVLALGNRSGRSRSASGRACRPWSGDVSCATCGPTGRCTGTAWLPRPAPPSRGCRPADSCACTRAGCNRSRWSDRCSRKGSRGPTRWGWASPPTATARYSEAPAACSSRSAR